MPSVVETFDPVPKWLSPSGRLCVCLTTEISSTVNNARVVKFKVILI